jgi:hypothetical protein
MIITRWPAFLAVLLLIVSITNIAQAASLQFDIANAQTSGSISYLGGTNPLSGTNIEIVDIIGLGTSSNDGITSTCTGCVLDFTTGDYTGFTGDTWLFESGGTVSITGGVDFPDSTTDISGGSTLLSGTFSNAELHDHSNGTLHLHINAATFTDTKHSSLTDFYGLPGGLYNGGVTITFQTTSGISPGTDFNSNILNSGSVLNQPVPVPAAFWLFGSGLIGLIGMAKRKT